MGRPQFLHVLTHKFQFGLISFTHHCHLLLHDFFVRVVPISITAFETLLKQIVKLPERLKFPSGAISTLPLSKSGFREYLRVMLVGFRVRTTPKIKGSVVLGIPGNRFPRH